MRLRVHACMRVRVHVRAPVRVCACMCVCVCGGGARVHACVLALQVCMRALVCRCRHVCAFVPALWCSYCLASWYVRLTALQGSTRVLCLCCVDVDAQG